MNNNNKAVKTEKRNISTPAPRTAEEKELDEWARRLVARPTPQIGGQAQTLSSFLNLATALTGADGLQPHNGYDLESAIGKFTWHTIAEDKYVPCIFRCTDQFCVIRMAEISVIGEFLRVLPVELYECVHLTSHYLTSVEVGLLNHINKWHCDGFYGSEPFSTKDQLISVTDLDKFYDYLSFAYSVLSSGGRNDAKDFSKCAFLKVNSDNLIPYTVLPTEEKGVPLFYFEGQTDILKEKAVPLKGWELAYLKVCCKVQGVRKDLIAGSTLQIVKVSDLRSYFPRRTVFTEECWPEPKLKSLLSKSNGISVGFANSAMPSCDKWTTNTPYKNAAAPSSNTPANPAPTMTAAPPRSNSSSTTNPNPPVSISNQSVNSQPPVIAVRNGTTVVPSVAVRVANGTPNIPTGLQAKSEALKKIKVTTPPLDTSRLQIIPEYADQLTLRDNAYVVRLIIIDKELMHCINMHPSKNDPYLVVLQEFMAQFFPFIAVYPTAVSVLKSNGVSTYLPNQAQIRTLNSFGFNIQHPWQMPLIPAVGATQSMVRLRSVFKPVAAAHSSILNNSTRSNGYIVQGSAR